MIEKIKELSLDSELDAFRQGEHFGDIQIAPEEIRSAQIVASENGCA
jgi:hypothetical protein